MKYLIAALMGLLCCFSAAGQTNCLDPFATLPDTALGRTLAYLVPDDGSNAMTLEYSLPEEDLQQLCLGCGSQRLTVSEPGARVINLAAPQARPGRAPVAFSIFSGPMLLDSDERPAERGYSFGTEGAYTFTPRGQHVGYTAGFGIMRLGWNGIGLHRTVGYGFLGASWKGWQGTVRTEIHERFQAAGSLRKAWQLRPAFDIFGQVGLALRGGEVTGVADQWSLQLGFSHYLPITR